MLEITAAKNPSIWLIVFLAMLATMGGSIPFQGLAVFYPFIKSELNLTWAQVGLITSALAIGSMGTSILGGWITDVVGVKRVVVIFLTAVGTLMFLFPFVFSIFSIMLLVVIIGIAQGPSHPAVTRAIMDWIPHRTRGLAMSVRLTGAPLSGAIAAAILPSMAIVAGWRTSAVILGVLVMLIGLVFLIAYRDSTRDKAIATPSFSLATLRPIMQNRNLLLATSWGAIFVSINVIVITYLILFFERDLGMSVVLAGTYLAIAQVSSIAARIVWGAVSDFVFRGRRRIVLGIVGVLTTLSLLSMVIIDIDTPRSLILLVALMLGVIMAWPGVFTTYVGELAEVGSAGTAIGAVSTVMLASVISLPPIFGLLVDISGSYHFAWGVVAVLALMGTLVLAGFGSEPNRTERMDHTMIKLIP